MLDIALKFLSTELNAHLLARTGDSFGSCDVARIVDDTGKWAIQDDHIGISLIHIEEERNLKHHLPETKLVNGRQIQLQPALKLNLHVMFAARFVLYDQALKYLAHVLTFFQSHLTFTSDGYALDPRIERLNVELMALSYEQLNQLWAFVGSKQLPSVVYKVRVVSVQDIAPMSIGTPITALDPNVHSL